MKYILPLDLVELEERNFHLTLKSVFPDGTEQLWVIDTGASRSVFDIALTACFDLQENDQEMKVRSAGIGSDHLETSAGILRPFRLNNLEVKSMKVALINLSHINDLYFHAVEKKICGLLGSDFLLENRALIDYASMKITLRPPKMGSVQR